MSDTIFALATAPGRAAISIVRVSGERAHSAVNALFDNAVSSERVMHLRVLRDPETKDIIDQGLVVLFPEVSSPTGERYGELHLHGGMAAPSAALRALGTMIGLRMAEPGEFSRRALHNNRLDLTQIEGVADLVDAQTEGQRRQALRLLQGGFSGRVAEWREALIQARALVEATIDFSDEDLPDHLMDEAIGIVATLSADLHRSLAGARAGKIVREGFEVAIVGPPNVGKSSLINVLAGRDVALTAPTPGTTRDIIELGCAINGHLVTFLDTAGLRDSADPVEQAGVALARKRAEAADLRVMVWAPGCPRLPIAADNDILVWNKADIASGPGINISALTGKGVEGVMSALALRLGLVAAEADVVVRDRHREMLEAALEHLQAAGSVDIEVCAEELRLATSALDRLVGGVDCEDVLGQIFSELCIGK